MSGRVESVGSNVKNFKTGDEVFGDLSGRWGGFAEYVCAPTKSLMLKPHNMSFEQAASLPQAGLLAFQGLHNRFEIKSGQHVLINGAGGGAGTFAIQLAKSMGAEVTGVDSGLKLETMLSVGADQVIDYKLEDFTKNGVQYDLILDNAAFHTVSDYKRSLKPNGHYIMVGGSSSLAIQVMLFGPLISLTSKKKFKILMHRPNKFMPELIKYFEEGKIIPIIDRYYTLDRAQEALTYFLEGKAKGKLVLQIIVNR